jgi:predicted phosphodiesterase
MNLPSRYDYIIIGDVHGCIDELKQLLIQNGFIINKEGFILSSSSTKSIVLLGDFIDKSSHQKIAETIDFIYKNYYHLNQNRQRLYLILGNHEDKVYRYITNDPTLEITPKTIKEKYKYYNTVELLEKDSKLKAKFLKLYRESFFWLKYSYSNEFSVTMTHSPCQKEYLTKDDTKSQKMMVKSVSRSKNFGVRVDILMPFIYQEAEDNRHYYIFGHLSQPNIRKYKNRICIDTSAIYGGSLTCAIIKKDKLLFDSVLFQNEQKPVSQVYNILFDF